MHAEHNDTMKTSDTVFQKNIPLTLFEGCDWEGVGDRTELQNIDPHSIGHNRLSFPFSWAAQPEARGSTLPGAGYLNCILSPMGLVSKLTDFLSSLSYIIAQRTPSSCGRHKSHSFNPSTVNVIILIFLDWMHLLFT